MPLCGTDGHTGETGKLAWTAKLPYPLQGELIYPDEKFKTLVEVLKSKGFYKTK